MTSLKNNWTWDNSKILECLNNNIQGLNQQDSRGDTALINSLKKNNTFITEKILSYKDIDINAQNNIGSVVYLYINS